MVACNGVDAVTWLTPGSIFTTRPFSALATQTAPSAKTIGRRRQRGRDAAQDLPFGGVDAHRLRPARDPDRAGSVGDALGLAMRSPRIGTENVFTIRPVVPSRRTSPDHRPR